MSFLRLLFLPFCCYEVNTFYLSKKETIRNVAVTKLSHKIQKHLCKIWSFRMRISRLDDIGLERGC